MTTTEPAIPVPAEILATAEAWDHMWTQLLGGIPFDCMTDTVRAFWLATVGPRWCDCPCDPHHRWNCPMTPLWAQTMCDLDLNPWTVMRPAYARGGLIGAPLCHLCLAHHTLGSPCAEQHREDHR
ncbi:hypothetical protein [Mycobacterium sp. PSTR-4-N]|uniref:hypothetical protein n=1 Tax=Mycobacterium sp. PSTR-4-N TaxID=2917745 RepID=UPI001F14AAFF|nr:hypothetical protein [Mycobacterium sp. PSTR-4-N]MCG7592414.1 hypothetical protein [Mycobacterium sp. PSTR-4-N]